MKASLALAWRFAEVSLLAGLTFFCQAASGQTFAELRNLPTPQLELLPPAATKALDTANSFATSGEFEDACTWLTQFTEEGAGKLIELQGGAESSSAGFHRFVPVESYADWKLLQLYQQYPQESLTVRQQKTPLAQSLLQSMQQARRTTSASSRAAIPSALFTSVLGGEALLLCGDHHLERGEFAAARDCYLRIHFLSEGVQTPLPWRGFANSNIPAADVLCRLIMVAFLQEDFAQGERELKLLKERFSNAEMLIGGKKQRCVSYVENWLQAYRKRQEAIASSQPADRLRLGNLAWSLKLPQVVASQGTLATHRVWPGDDAHAIRAYTPILLGNQLLLSVEDQLHSQILSLDAATGKTKWQGAISRAPLAKENGNRLGAEYFATQSDIHQGQSNLLGTWRSGLVKSDDQKIFFRAGPAQSGAPVARQSRLTSRDVGLLWGLDPTKQGKTLEGFPLRTESTAWSFEGEPIVSQGKLFITMRRSDGPVRQLYLACFDLRATPIAAESEGSEGTLLWRTRLLSGPSLSQGSGTEIERVNAVLDEGVLYLCTNAGTLTAMDPTSGQPLWVTTYPRSGIGKTVDSFPPEHLFRDGETCVAWRHLLICMPPDYRGMFAVNRHSGQILWTLEGTTLDATRILGIQQETLLVSGDVLYWIDPIQGKLLTQFPGISPETAAAARVEPRGIGRGVLGTNHIYFPTRESIYLFEIRPTRQGEAFRPTQIGSWNLATFGAEGGNLLFHPQGLFITSSNRLFAFHDNPMMPADPPAQQLSQAGTN